MNENETTKTETTETPPVVGTNADGSPRATITIPDQTFEVEEGLPDLPAGGRSGQSKYSPLIAQAKALKINQRFKVPRHGVPYGPYSRNVRLAFKKANVNVKIAEVKGEDSVWVFRTA